MVVWEQECDKPVELFVTKMVVIIITVALGLGWLPVQESARVLALGQLSALFLVLGRVLARKLWLVLPLHIKLGWVLKFP